MHGFCFGEGGVHGRGAPVLAGGFALLLGHDLHRIKKVKESEEALVAPKRGHSKFSLEKTRNERRLHGLYKKVAFDIHD